MRGPRYDMIVHLKMSPAVSRSRHVPPQTDVHRSLARFARNLPALSVCTRVFLCPKQIFSAERLVLQPIRDAEIAKHHNQRELWQCPNYYQTLRTWLAGREQWPLWLEEVGPGEQGGTFHCCRFRMSGTLVHAFMFLGQDCHFILCLIIDTPHVIAWRLTQRKTAVDWSSAAPIEKWLRTERKLELANTSWRSETRYPRAVHITQRKSPKVKDL